MLLVPAVSDIAEAVRIMAKSHPGAQGVLRQVVAKYPIATAWTVLYRLDEKGVYGKTIAVLYEQCGSTIEQFVCTVKARRFLHNKGEK